MWLSLDSARSLERQGMHVRAEAATVRAGPVFVLDAIAT